MELMGFLWIPHQYMAILSQSQDRVMMTLAGYGWMKYLLVTFRSILRTHVQFLLNIAMEAMAH